MNTTVSLGLVAALCLFLTGCEIAAKLVLVSVEASTNAAERGRYQAALNDDPSLGPKASEVLSSMPPIPAGMGRVFLFRARGGHYYELQPEMILDGVKVGQSIPGGYFFIDQPPGVHEVATGTHTVVIPADRASGNCGPTLAMSMTMFLWDNRPDYCKTRSKEVSGHTTFTLGLGEAVYVRTTERFREGVYPEVAARQEDPAKEIEGLRSIGSQIIGGAVERANKAIGQ
jgi:hypothetical protein